MPLGGGDRIVGVKRGLAALASVPVLGGDLVPARVWLDRLALLVPGTTATRWLLVADLACLVAMGRATRRPALGVALALVAGLVALTVAGMVVTDFYLGLALFHLAVGVTAAIAFRPARWAGVALVGLALVLGMAT